MQLEVAAKSKLELEEAIDIDREFGEVIEY